MSKKRQIFIFGLATAVFAINSVWDTGIWRCQSIVLCILSFTFFLQALLDYYSVISKRLLGLFSSSVGITCGVIFIIIELTIETNKAWMIFWISMSILLILLILAELQELRHPHYKESEW